MSVSAPASHPRLSISTASMGLALAFAVQLVTVLMYVGGLMNRVQAVERTVEPVAQGKLAVLDERTLQIQQDVAWMRSQMQRGAPR